MATFGSKKNSGKKFDWKDQDGVENFIDNIAIEHPDVKSRHLQMVYYYALYLGAQYYLPDFQNNALVKAELERNARSVYNVIAGFVDTFVAKLLKDDPVPQFRPLSFDDDDVKSNRVSNIFIEWWWGSQGMPDKMYDSARWAAITGDGIIKIHYKKEGGPLISCNDISVDSGQIVAAAVSPFTFFRDPAAKDLRDASWCLEEYRVPRSTIELVAEGRIPKAKIESMTNDSGDMVYKDTLAGYTMDTTTAAMKAGNFFEPTVTVDEFWARPVKGFDHGKGKGNGRYTIRAGGVTVYDEKFPEKYTRLPYFEYHVLKPMDSIHGNGLVERIVDAQLDLNRINSLTMENIDWTAIIKFVAPLGSRLGGTTVNRDAGEIIDIDMKDGGKLYQLPMAGMPAYVQSHRSEIMQFAMDAVGLHEVSFAQLPARGSQSSGRTLGQLVEAEAVRFAPVVRDTKRCITEIALFVLDLCKGYFPEEQIAQIYGRYRGTEIAHFKGADIRTQKDVFCEVGNGFGLSASARNEQLLNLWDRKVIQDPQKLLKLTEFGSMDRLYYDASLAENKANRHLETILNWGTMPDVSEYDDHMSMIKVVTDFIQRPDFDDLPKKMKLRIEEYITVHKKFLQPPVQMAPKGGATPPKMGPEPEGPVGPPPGDGSLPTQDALPQGLPPMGPQ